MRGRALPFFLLLAWRMYPPPILLEPGVLLAPLGALFSPGVNRLVEQPAFRRLVALRQAELARDPSAS